MIPEPSGPAPDGPSLRVLCVDDNRDVADSEADLLGVTGFDARACYDGATALVEAGRFRPSVCLIDLNMPGMGGDELAVRLRQLPDPPVVLVAVTARSDEDGRTRVRDAGFDLHLVKPVDPHTLLDVIDQLWRAWEESARANVSARGSVP